jgi:hypothetical protein
VIYREITFPVMGMLKKIVRNCKRSKDKPVDKEIDEDSGGTTGIEEDAEVSGTFPTADPPCVPEELKGARGHVTRFKGTFCRRLGKWLAKGTYSETNSSDPCKKSGTWEMTQV